MQLAALYNNFNVNRKQAKTTSSEFIFNSACSKRTGCWVAKPVYEAKSYEWVKELIKNVKETYLGIRESYPCYAPDLPQNIAKTAKPPVFELVNKRNSVYKCSNLNYSVNRPIYILFSLGL